MDPVWRWDARLIDPDNGEPLCFGRLAFYRPDDREPATVYYDEALTKPAPHPVMADNFGEVTVYGRGRLKARVFRAPGKPLFDLDAPEPN